MTVPSSEQLQSTLKEQYVHLTWENDYRTLENEKFYEEAFDYLANILCPPLNSSILDAGCGPCANSIRLAKRGFQVTAVDFSESALTIAQENLRSNGLENKVELRKESLLELSFEDGKFDFVLCWGVFMHIDDIEAAISELCRVVKKGGTLILSEGNKGSMQSFVRNMLKRNHGGTAREIKVTPAGVENWKITPAGKLLIRDADISWLIKRLEDNGFVLRKHIAGQFTELYIKCSSRFLQRIIHGFNRFWFRSVRSPGPAFGNILIFDKS